MTLRLFFTIAALFLKGTCAFGAQGRAPAVVAAGLVPAVGSPMLGVGSELGGVQAPLLALPLPPLIAPAQVAAPRSLANDLTHHELRVDPNAHAEVVSSFYTFRDYMDAMLHHPRWGYYTSGRVSIGEDSDFNTYPILASPHFGNAAVEQAFRMWQGMIKAGTLGPEETFDVAEFGGGEGTLAHDFLDHAQKRSVQDERWAAFTQRLRYTIHERSPALRERQTQKNAGFGEVFRSVPADARAPLMSLPEGAMKGLVLSNELPDAFGVHKVILGTDGSAEAAFVVPRLPPELLQSLRQSPGGAEIHDQLQAIGQEVSRRFGFDGLADHEGSLFLDRGAFETLLNFLSGLSPEAYADMARQLQFHEVYVPAVRIPALAAHLGRNIADYAAGLATSAKPWLGYINVDADRYIEESGRALKAGYVVTLDYGNNLLKIMHEFASQRLRTYSKALKGGYDPYAAPTFIDMTTDVNFTALAEAGRTAGLRTLHFGVQGDMAEPVKPQILAAVATLPALDKQRRNAESFLYGSPEYKVLVQQKDGTDPSFRFADASAEVVSPLRRAAEIQENLQKHLAR